MFTPAFFVMVRNWTQVTYPPMGGCETNDASISRNTTQPYKEMTYGNTTTLMDLKGTLLEKK